MFMKKSTLFFFLLFTIVSFAQKPCEKDPIYNQFDFWIGEWKVYDLKGNLAGQSKITKILDNCVVLEEWTSAKEQQGLLFSGKSFNSYNSATKQWQQNWIDNTGGSTEYLTGHFENDAMHFISRPFNNGGKTTSVRKLTFYKLKDGKVRQHGEISNNEGKDWVTEYDLEYRPEN
ncbi:hypothetical protein SAMN05444363_2135 [Flavobacterium terrae]|uniref:DUF1579 domain-containing protein n=2 Tax=Flavobacterium terrae TaxID=415425 RepID=A0A1M6F4S5_9FLAO|nr:hypothetical protein SAMN05444363_2135 [Flavobacterium terrae]